MSTAELRIYRAPRMTDEHVLVTLYMRPAKTPEGQAIRMAVITRLELGIAIRAELGQQVAP